jgi:hypothetical protein
MTTHKHRKAIMKNNSSTFLLITQTLKENVSHIKYGEASVNLKVHAGRVVSVTHSLTENTRKIISEKEIQKEDTIE